jgi:hypothetical protein
MLNSRLSRMVAARVPRYNSRRFAPHLAPASVPRFRGVRALTETVVNTPHEHERLETPGDDLRVARRLHVRALERVIRLRLHLLGAIDDIERAERALEDGKRRAVAKSLRSARGALSGNSARGIDRWPRTARIDGEFQEHESIRPGTHRFVGMWRPPVAPASPQELSCIAIVCTCLEQLTEAVRVQQHWETGCFDLPEYETLPQESQDWAELLKLLESD